MSNTVTLRLRIETPAAAVFQALVDLAALEIWLTEHADVSLGEGCYELWGRYLPGGERGRTRLVKAEPNRALCFAWQLRGAETEVALELAADGAATDVTLTHSGLSEPASEEHAFWWLSLLNLRSYLEGRTLVPKCDFTRRRHGEARAEVEIDAPAEDVFAALTDPEQLDRWIAVEAEVDLRPGGTFDFGWDNEGPVKIVEVVPNEVVAYSWLKDGREDTIVRWELEGSEGRTRLTLVHSGFAGGDPSNYQLGWQAFLADVKELVEAGPVWRRIDSALATP